MKIYHYTTIDSLAQILKKKTLLFNRLDCVDDLEEGSVVSSGVEVGKYVFVSCWTESDEESIPLWKMYAGDKMGVRIGLEKDMFKSFLIQNPTIGKLHGYGGIFLFNPQEELETKDYFLITTPASDGDFFYRKIQYVDNVAEKTRDAVSIAPDGKGHANANISFGEIGRYKHKRWQFQKESRFVLTILPFNPFLANPDEVSTITLNSFMQNKPIGFSKYFLHLKEAILNNIEITLCPNASEGQQIIVESLTKLYAPNATIKPSTLGHLVRM